MVNFFTYSPHTPSQCVRMKLLALVLLLSAFPSLTLMKVVQDFAKATCTRVFIKSPNVHTVITPTVFEGEQYKHICQCWNNKCTFATLYNTQLRIPVYSAYTLSGKDDQKPNRNEEWKNEPQLENINRPNMEQIPINKMDEFFHQAVNRDYEESESNTEPKTKYTRGHVFPNQYAADDDQAESTFTFTNVAPQTAHSNNRWAEQVETPMKKEIPNVCNKSDTSTFIVTGVVPGKNWISIKRKGKTIEKGVNIPSYYWTAFCCYISKNETRSKAYLSLQNQPNIMTYEFSRMSVDRLNIHLTRLYNQSFSVFSQLCLN
ncbi:endonuclease domain-containing 1 protein-like [Clarias gariepinus]|uniref:endonuclease domain-containing 1 protein-like n=1 Tax=Clarias gariepinus TaxID=13013 RepID=UPI00234D7CE0|nr:endonuclease domain-containing 1 protein-like [Clarias gariepinus]